MITYSTFLQRLSYWANRLVIRWQLLLIIAVLWLSGLWLRTNYGTDDSNLWIVMNQFLSLLRWTMIGLFLIGILLNVLSWVFFVYAFRHKRIVVKTKFGDGYQAEAGTAPLRVVINGFFIRPLLGTIRARLIFTGKRLSESIILDGNLYARKGWSREAIHGSGTILLHDRGIHDVEKVLISFHDMFGLMALPYTISMNQQLFTLPKGISPTSVKAHPNTTEIQTHRIEIPRRVEGEYIAYKEFESGDNIQRIVWKIYAKSGQLVVRVPETKDPYASHLYFYASFYDGLSMANGAFEMEMLNIYKDRVRNLFEALLKNGYDVRVPHDQEVPKLPGIGDKKNELFAISAAGWQQNLPLSVFVQPAKAAFVCASSLTPALEIEAMFRNLPNTVPVAVAKLSEAIPSPFRIGIKDLFFKPDPHPADNLRQPWLLSPLRRKLIKNEKEIEILLKRRGNSWLVKSIDVS